MVLALLFIVNGMLEKKKFLLEKDEKGNGNSIKKYLKNESFFKKNIFLTIFATLPNTKNPINFLIY